MNHKARHFIFGFVFACQLAFGDTRCGGEGPKPFVDVTAEFQHHWQLVKTPGNVKDFLVWENQNALLYRDSSDRLQTTSLITNDTQFLTWMTTPLARLVDPSERYILGFRHGWGFFDTAQPGAWISFSQEPLEPLFWYGAHFYGLKSTINRKGEQNLLIYRYRAGTQLARVVCEYTMPAGNHFRVANGHADPYAYFYQVENTPRGKYLILFRLNVFDCALGWEASYVYPIEGEIEDVFRFVNIDSAAIVINHPTKKLLWDTPRRCQYYDLENMKPIIFTDKQPVLATWSQQKGLNLFYLDAGKKARILGGLPMTHLTPSDLWLTSNGKRLFVASEMERGRKVIEVFLPAFPRR